MAEGSSLAERLGVSSLGQLKRRLIAEDKLDQYFEQKLQGLQSASLASGNSTVETQQLRSDVDKLKVVFEQGQTLPNLEAEKLRAEVERLNNELNQLKMYIAQNTQPVVDEMRPMLNDIKVTVGEQKDTHQIHKELVHAFITNHCRIEPNCKVETGVINDYLYHYGKQYNEPIYSREVKGLMEELGFKWYKGHRDCYYQGLEILPQ